VERALSSRETCEVGEIRWWLGPGVAPARARPILEGALRQIEAGAVNLRSGRRKELYRLAIERETPDYLLKVNRYERGAGRIRRLRRSKARRELAVAEALGARGIDTPLPFAAGEARSGNRLICCYLLIPLLDAARDLMESWSQTGIPRAERASWATALGALSAKLHDAGLLQEDFAPNNFLLQRGDPPRILPIDFERARIRRAVGAGARSRMLAKLDRHLAGASAANRMRFLIAYAGGDRSAARRWWRRLPRASARLAALDLARLRRTGSADGRRFRNAAWGEWNGWAVRSAPELALAESRTTGPDSADPPETLALLVEADGFLWRASGPASRRRARNVWAAALMLWGRGGLVPRPVACLTRGDEMRLWLARDPVSQTLLECCDSGEAQRAAVVLVDRLLALGRLDRWLSTRKIALARRPDGSLSAQLLDPTAFRTARPARRRRRERARKLVMQRLQEVRKLRAILRGSSP
jgi:tRNA A-37 threonylcarbamoyl transferase component Bud32